jgi:diguanylate cyclase (GGDEF)-like protein
LFLSLLKGLVTTVIESPNTPEIGGRTNASFFRVEAPIDDLLPGKSNEASFRRTLLAYRHAMLIVIAVILYMTVSPGTPGRFYALGGIGVDLVFGGLALHLVKSKKHSRMSMIPWLQAAAMLALTTYVPTMQATLFLIGLCLYSINSPLHGTWPSTLALLAVIAATPVLTVWRHGHFDLTFLLMFTVFIPAAGVIAERVRSNELSSRRQYVELLTGLDAVVWEGDPSTMKRTFVSPQSRDLLKLDPRALMERWSEYVYPDDREREAESRQAGVANERDFVIDFRMMAADGSVVFVRDTVRVERDSSGKPTRMRGVLVDITRQQAAEDTVRKQALYDNLTGLPNRSLFNDQLRQRLEQAKQNKEGIAVLLLDLNGFKEVNDTLGHAVGDHLLQAIAGRLSTYLSDAALVARLGGDEFAVLIHPGNGENASAAAETIASCLTLPITVDDMTIQAGASTGIALYPGDGDDGASLLRRADAAMYEAKQTGRSHMFATPDDDVANVRRLQLLGELRAAIATGDFRLYHQPKLDMKTGRIVGTEGLVRWQHPQFGLLSPVEFIELSELSGLIMPLTRYLLEIGIAQAAAWRAQGFEIAVAINLSVRNFFDQGLPEFIRELLDKHRLPGKFLVLEITEREVMSDRALARAALSQFRELGVKISVDDFGTGFSSLSQLQLLPIDEIKIDASFVRNMLTNAQDMVIVKSIIDLGHNLGLEVVAEGAETPGELTALRDLGADRLQGYVISKPMPAEDLTKWLRKLAGQPEEEAKPVEALLVSDPAIRPSEPVPRASRLLAQASTRRIG